MLLVGWQEGHPACKKTEWSGTPGYLTGTRCRLAYGPVDATATQIGFSFLVPAHPGSPGQRAIKRVCVCLQCFDAVGWAAGRASGL